MKSCNVFDLFPLMTGVPDPRSPEERYRDDLKDIARMIADELNVKRVKLNGAQIWPDPKGAPG